MTRPNSTLVLQRASERLSAGAAALAVTFLMLFTVSVRAADPVSIPSSVTVRYSMLAFSTPDGATAVYRKLKSAARMVCGLNSGESLTLDRRLAAQECFDAALAEAVRKIDRPVLTSVHVASVRKLG